MEKISTIPGFWLTFGYGPFKANQLREERALCLGLY